MSNINLGHLVSYINNNGGRIAKFDMQPTKHGEEVFHVALYIRVKGHVERKFILHRDTPFGLFFFQPVEDMTNEAIFYHTEARAMRTVTGLLNEIVFNGLLDLSRKNWDE